MSSIEPTPTADDEAREAFVLEIDEIALVDDDDDARDEPHGLLTRVGAELVGTFAVVLAVVGALLYTGLSGAGAVGVALAGGGALVGMTALFGHVSGAHLNPAVSLACAVARRTSWLDSLLYVTAQVLGAVLAVAVLFVTVPDALPGLVDAANPEASAVDFVATTANGWGDGSPLSLLSGGQVTFGLVAALVVELLGAALLAGVVLGRRGRGAAVPVGLTYAALLLVVGPVTNAALNPARASAVALISAGSTTVPLSQLWLFWVAPLLGGAIAGLAALAFARPVVPPAELADELGR